KRMLVSFSTVAAKLNSLAKIGIWCRRLKWRLTI
ncbi:MAG: hypothetical protein ACI84O_001481, partial [Myxococcota bacterium]